MKRMFSFLGLAVALAMVAGCAGTLHYRTYATEQSKVLVAQEKTRQAQAEAWGKLFEHGDAQGRSMAAMGLLVHGLTAKQGQLQAPRDEWAKGLGILAPWLGAWSISHEWGKAMQGHGGQTTTTTYEANANGAQSSIAITPGNSNATTISPTDSHNTTTTTTNNEGD